MPLRYLQLREPVYTPSYNPIDLSVASGIVDTIGARADSALDARRTLGDSLRENIQTGLADLRPEDQLFAQNQLFDIEQGIDDYIDEHGASRSLDYISRQAREFSQSIAPLTQRAQYGRQLQEIMNESDADSLTKSFVLGQVSDVEYDEETGLPKDWKGRASERDVETIKNWRRFDEVLSDYNKGWKASSQESAGFSGGQEFPDETITYFREKLKGLGFGEVEAGNVQLMLSDPQLRNQLDLMGRAEIEFKGENSGISVSPDGRVTTTVPVPKVNANGVPLNIDGQPAKNAEEVAYDIREKTFDSIAEWQALRQAAPYALREAYQEISYDTRNAGMYPGAGTGRGRSNEPYLAGYHFNTFVDFEVGEMDASEFYAQAAESAKYLQEQAALTTLQADSLLRNFEGENGAYTTVFDGDQLIIKDGNIQYSLDDEIPNLPETTKRLLRGFQDSYRQTNQQALNFSADIKRINNSVLNALAKDPRFSGLAEAASFGDHSEITFDPEILQETFDINKLNFSSISDRDSFNVDLNSIREGELVSAIRTHTPSALGAVTGEMRQTHQFQGFLYNDGGEIKWASNNNEELNKFRMKAKELQQQNVDIVRDVGIHSFNFALLDGTSSQTLDRILLDHFKEGRIRFGEQGGDGNLIDREGKGIKLKNGQRFVASSIGGGLDGQLVIAGSIVDAEDNEVHSNARVTGRVVDDAAASIWEDHRAYITTQQLSAMIPKIIDNVRNMDTDDEFKITPATMVSLGIVDSTGKSSLKEDLGIRLQRLRQGESVHDTFIVNYGGNPYYAYDIEHLKNLLFGIEVHASGHERGEEILSSL